MDQSLWFYLLAAGPFTFSILLALDWNCSPKSAGEIRRRREAVEERARKDDDTSGGPPS
ncbi:hypothetical protein FHS94_001622 [Sphingomonas aerophila]|uniref:Uncharacterized protein n=1 Tax=Sphingomonas aerophila TaxID=1344948 RepID=A0A7W9EU40_9SPHN|nr:hypothetical protein [Sphingomonas aerophila]